MNPVVTAEATRPTPGGAPPCDGVLAWFGRGLPADHQPPQEATHQPPTPGVTVAVCTYKRPESLRAFLDSLAEQDRKPQRLVIVDSSVDDRTEEVVRHHPALASVAISVLYFRVTRRSLTCSRNFALRWVLTDLVVFFDDDVVLQPGCLREMEAPHRAYGQRVVGVGAHDLQSLRHPDPHWRVRRLLGVVPTLRGGQYTRSGISLPWAFLEPTEDLVEGDWLTGFAMMWKTAVARQAGFNERFGETSIGEDLEFSLRMGCYGKLLLAGKARVRHLPDLAGRASGFMRGYTAIRNAYVIHRTCLRRRTRADELRFLYAFGVDTLLKLAAVVRPGPVRTRWQSVCGRLWFFGEHLLGFRALV